MLTTERGTGFIRKLSMNPHMQDPINTFYGYGNATGQHVFGDDLSKTKLSNVMRTSHRILALD